MTKQLGLHLTFKTSDLQVFIYTTLGGNIKANSDWFFLFVPIFIPDAQTQIMFNDSNKNSFTLSFDSWSTDRKTCKTQLEYQVQIDSAENINNPKYLTVAHQTEARTGVPNKVNIFSIFDNLNVRKYHVDIDGVRNPKDGVSIDYTSNGYI